MLVDLAICAGVLEDFAPLDLAVACLRLAQAEHLVVHLLVRRQHAHQVPHALGCLVATIQEAEQGLELLLVGTQGVSWHLILSESDIFFDLAEFLQVKAHIVLLEILMDGLQTDS